MLEELQQISKITKENELEVMKKLVVAVRKLDERTEKVADWTGSQDMSLMSALLEEQHETNARLGKVEGRLGNLENAQKETNNRLGNLETEMKGVKTEIQGLRSEMLQTREETIELLRMIAHNTQKT